MEPPDSLNARSATDGPVLHTDVLAPPAGPHIWRREATKTGSPPGPALSRGPARRGLASDPRTNPQLEAPHGPA